MRNYEEIMGLVEEVRGILTEKGPHLDKDGNQVKGKLHHMTHKSLVKSHGSMTANNPFKNIKRGKNLGGTDGSVATRTGPSTTTPGKQRKFWRCRCSGYKCLCFAKTKEGKKVKKVVHIDHQYKKTYNAKYRVWRKKHAKLFKAGGKRGFTKPKKTGGKGYSHPGHQD